MVSIFPSSLHTLYVWVQHLDIEHWFSLTGESCESDIKHSFHIHHEVSVVLIVRVVGVSQHILSKIQCLVTISNQRGSVDWRLTESVHVVHILPIRDEIVQSIIWSQSDVVAAFVVVALFSAIISDGIILIVFSGHEMLGVIVPLRVEKDLVEDQIGQDDDWPFLNRAPPWSEWVETFFILGLEILVKIISITYLNSVLKLNVIYGLKLILKTDLVLSSLAAKNGKEDGAIKVVDSSYVLNHNLIDGTGSSRLQIMAPLIRVWVIETHEKVSIALQRHQLDA